MYYVAGQPTLNWLSSFYSTEPGSPPPGGTSVNWTASTIQTTLIDVLGYGFTPGKSELLPFHTTIVEANPNLGQNPGY
jgi:hypothetical protein